MDFREAVEYAKAQMKDAASDEFNDEVKRVAATSGGVRMLRRDPAALSEWAKHSPDGFDWIRHGISELLVCGEPIPAKASEWLTSFMRSPNPPKPGKGGRQPNFYFNLRVFMTIEILVASGLTATRSDTHDSGNSACDAMATALIELGLAPRSYARVKRIYLDFRKAMKPPIAAT